MVGAGALNALGGGGLMAQRKLSRRTNHHSHLGVVYPWERSRRSYRNPNWGHWDDSGADLNVESPSWPDRYPFYIKSNLGMFPSNLAIPINANL